jgi:hypothetical protein
MSESETSKETRLVCTVGAVFWIIGTDPLTGGVEKKATHVLGKDESPAHIRVMALLMAVCANQAKRPDEDTGVVVAGTERMG